MILITLFAAAFLCLIAVTTIRTLVRIRSGINTATVPPPPTVPGLPLLGNVLQLATHGSTFLQLCRQHHGNTFQLNLLTQRIVFLFSPHHVGPFYFRTKQLSFAPAVQQFTQQVFGLPSSEFYHKHTTMLSALRQLLQQGTLHTHAHAVLDRLNHYHSTITTSSIHNLYTLISELVFNTGVDSLFGRAFLSRHGHARMRTLFFQFEQQFELAASPLPHIFQPTFIKSRRQLLSALKTSYELGDFDDENGNTGTVVGTLLKESGLDERYYPNLLLCILWASQANTVPASFWSLAFLLLPENRHYKQDIIASISVNDNDEMLIQLACDKDSLLHRCCLEAVRLRAHSIDVRIATSDIITPPSNNSDNNNNNKSYLIKKGSIVAISPYHSHTDNDDLYVDAATYNPDRDSRDMVLGDLHSGTGTVGMGGIGGLSFGAGYYRCPGRGFAEMEMGVLVGEILRRYEMELVGGGRGGSSGGGNMVSVPGDAGGGLPAPDMSRLVGVKLPKGECMVRVTKKRREAMI